MTHDAAPEKDLERGDFDTWAQLSVLLGKLAPEHASAELTRVGISAASFEARSKEFGQRMRDERPRGVTELGRRYAAIADLWVGASLPTVRTAVEELASRLRPIAAVACRTEAIKIAAVSGETLPFRPSPDPQPVRCGITSYGHVDDGTAVTPMAVTDDTLPFARVGTVRVPFERFVEWLALKRQGRGTEVTIFVELGIQSTQSQCEAIVYWERRMARDDLLRGRVEALVAIRERGMR